MQAQRRGVDNSGEFSPDIPLLLRGHHLLCLHTYRGKGYSGAFVCNLDRIVTELQRNQDRPVRLTVLPDVVCALCPHLQEGAGCEKEVSVRAHDLAVLQALQLDEGREMPADLALATSLPRLRELIDATCGFCQWQLFCLAVLPSLPIEKSEFVLNEL